MGSQLFIIIFISLLLFSDSSAFELSLFSNLFLFLIFLFLKIHFEASYLCPVFTSFSPPVPPMSPPHKFMTSFFSNYYSYSDLFLRQGLTVTKPCRLRESHDMALLSFNTAAYCFIAVIKYLKLKGGQAYFRSRFGCKVRRGKEGMVTKSSWLQEWACSPT